ncbi:DgyrCDS901 [Dimorphilus gyrociliatus]|uniref:DgyrCDS901 n=1 Tax=Dimorphilus gyrociliatus TaxID=2664684 RepID=A0A7I8V8S4_9ANNE|nr:DgyrCDS901 [Dimorphilus gyrociliatus]
MSRPGLFRQTVNSILRSFKIANRKEILIGSDEFGNKYFEKPTSGDAQFKRVRRVETFDKDQWSVPKVPTEWMAWLQNKRESAPSDEEILKNQIELAKRLKRSENLQTMRGESIHPDSLTMTENQGGFPHREEYEINPGSSRTEKT